VASFSRYRFGMQNCGQSAKVLLVTHEEEQRFGGEGFSAQGFERYAVLTRL
jgi:hypothetical protein